jgi:hypothetical protein
MSLMSKFLSGGSGRWLYMALFFAAFLATASIPGGVLLADEAGKMHGEADLELPDLNGAEFMGFPGRT